MKVQKIFEINPNDDTIKELNKRAVANKEDVSLKNLIYLLYHNSLLASGFMLENKVDFAEKIYSLIRIGVGVDEEEEEEEVEENSDSEELEGKSSSIDYENLETMD